MYTHTHVAYRHDIVCYTHNSPALRIAHCSPTSFPRSSPVVFCVCGCGCIEHSQQQQQPLRYAVVGQAVCQRQRQASRSGRAVAIVVGVVRFGSAINNRTTAVWLGSPILLPRRVHFVSCTTAARRPLTSPRRVLDTSSTRTHGRSPSRSPPSRRCCEAVHPSSHGIAATARHTNSLTVALANLVSVAALTDTHKSAFHRPTILDSLSSARPQPSPHPLLACLLASVAPLPV